jgi:hypothetical protein
MTDIFTQSSEHHVTISQKDYDSLLSAEIKQGVSVHEDNSTQTFDIRHFISEVLQQEQAAVTKTYSGKTYRASPGSVAVLKKSDDSAKKAVKAGKFSWAADPYAAAQAAHIVATGEPTVKKGTKRKKTTEDDVHEEKHCE